MIIVCLYVDDMLILNDYMERIIETKRFISSTFKMKYIRKFDTIFYIKVKRNNGGYALNQTHYIEKYKQLIQDGIIPISFVRSSGILDDSFTKSLTRILIRTTSKGMKLKLLK